jgi:hypothetical protein
MAVIARDRDADGLSTFLHLMLFNWARLDSTRRAGKSASRSIVEGPSAMAAFSGLPLGHLPSARPRCQAAADAAHLSARRCEVLLSSGEIGTNSYSPRAPRCAVMMSAMRLSGDCAQAARMASMARSGLFVAVSALDTAVGASLSDGAGWS